MFRSTVTITCIYKVNFKYTLHCCICLTRKIIYLTLGVIWVISIIYVTGPTNITSIKIVRTHEVNLRLTLLHYIWCIYIYIYASAFPPPRQSTYHANHVITSAPISTYSPTIPPPIHSPLPATPAIDVSLMAVCQYGNPRQYLAQDLQLSAPASVRDLHCTFVLAISWKSKHRHLHWVNQ